MNTDFKNHLPKLHQRAHILAQIRKFFAERNVLEVETPLLCSTTVTDPHIQSFQCENRYLQTSPEYAMKRLLSEGSGAIYQICKAFRREEAGRFHNPEFTLLEWYRPGFSYLDLIAEIDALLQCILKTPVAQIITYQQIFINYLQLDPLQASITELKNCALQHHIQAPTEIAERDTWLQILLSHLIEPQLGKNTPVFMIDFPASQAALATLSAKNPAVAERFELYYKGLELANGWHELANAQEQQQRFEKDLQQREKLGYPVVPIDQRLLASLDHLPDCSGVALGLDRLMMLTTAAQSISEVISFDWQNC